MATRGRRRLCGTVCVWLVAVQATNAMALTIHPESAPPGPLATAAAELRDYAASLPALADAEVILNSAPPRGLKFWRRLEGDAYAIECKGNTVTIRGGTERAVLFGAYDLLERLGVTWWAPGETHIEPVDDTLPELDIRAEPVFEHRGLVTLWDEWSRDELVRWAGRNRLNTVAFMRGPDSLEERAAQIAGLADEAAAQGIGLEVECHAMGALLPRSLFGEHPEYFRMDRHGQRTNDANLCTSSDAALRVVSENVKHVVRRFPESTKRFYFWQDDGAPWCACPDCRGLSAADQALRVANAIAAAVKSVRPGAGTAFLAYHDTLLPARETEPADGLFLEYAPISRCWAHVLDDGSCSHNVRHLSRLDELLEEHGAGGSQGLEYWLDVSRWSRWQKPSVRSPELPGVLQADLRAYSERGVENITTFCVGWDEEYFGKYTSFTAWAYPKLLWNPDADLASLRKRFCAVAGLPVETQRGYEAYSRALLMHELHQTALGLPPSAPEAESFKKVALRRIPPLRRPRPEDAE